MITIMMTIMMMITIMIDDDYYIYIKQQTIVSLFEGELGLGLFCLFVCFFFCFFCGGYLL